MLSSIIMQSPKSQSVAKENKFRAKTDDIEKIFCFNNEQSLELAKTMKHVTFTQEQ